MHCHWLFYIKRVIPLLQRRISTKVRASMSLSFIRIFIMNICQITQNRWFWWRARHTSYSLLNREVTYWTCWNKMRENTINSIYENKLDGDSRWYIHVKILNTYFNIRKHVVTKKSTLLIIFERKPQTYGVVRSFYYQQVGEEEMQNFHIDGPMEG